MPISLKISLDNCTDEELQILARRLPLGSKAPGIVWEITPRVARRSLFLRYLADQNGAVDLMPAPAQAEGAGVE